MKSIDYVNSLENFTKLSPPSHAENNIKGLYSQVKAQYITTQSQTIRGRLKIPSTTMASFIIKL
jgi:hypothetical protein